jgi:hypothetical protein
MYPFNELCILLTLHSFIANMTYHSGRHVRAENKQAMKNRNFAPLPLQQWSAGWGGSWRGARGVDAEKLREAREDVPRESFKESSW